MNHILVVNSEQIAGKNIKQHLGTAPGSGEGEHHSRPSYR